MFKPGTSQTNSANIDTDVMYADGEIGPGGALVIFNFLLALV
jgi:hypothetical protein